MRHQSQSIHLVWTPACHVIAKLTTPKHNGVGTGTNSNFSNEKRAKTNKKETVGIRLIETQLTLGFYINYRLKRQ